MTTAYAGPRPLLLAPRPSAAYLARADRAASKFFVHATLIFCIILQRFCVYAGASPIYWCLPVFLALLGWLYFTGRAEFRPMSVALYLTVAGFGVVSTLVAVNMPDPRIEGISITSLLSVLVLYAGLTLRPTRRFDASRTFDIFIFYLRICAALGIAQYLAQFVGFRLFSFMVAVPALKPILVEPLFNYHPIINYGSTIMRSNGFFLVEPSNFSQVLAAGILVEVFIRKQWRFLPLYAVAYLFTYAGTGLLSLSLACALLPLVAPTGAGRVFGFGIAMLLLVGVAAIALPDQFAALAGRATEVGHAGTSGHARYAAQFDAFAAVWGETRTLVGFGPGAFERASFYTPGSGNPTIKLYIDYGIFGLAAFFAFFITTIWRRNLALVSLFVIANFQFGGGSLLFPPFIILGAILCIWSVPPQPR